MPSTATISVYLRKLRVPKSVMECVLNNIEFEDLIIETNYNSTLKLQIDGCRILNTFECKCSLSDDSYIKNTYENQRLLPVDLKVSFNVLTKIDQSVYVSNYHILSLYLPMKPTLPYSMTFKVIINYTSYELKFYELKNLHATTWIGA